MDALLAAGVTGRVLGRTGDPLEQPRPRSHLVLVVGAGKRRWLADDHYGAVLRDTFHISRADEGLAALMASLPKKTAIDTVWEQCRATPVGFVSYGSVSGGCAPSCRRASRPRTGRAGSFAPITPSGTASQPITV